MACLDARRRNCGIDGKPVLFYSRRPVTAPPMRKPKKAAVASDDRHADLVDGLKGLGLAGITGSPSGHGGEGNLPGWHPRGHQRGGPAGCVPAPAATEFRR